jgi:hypothetical protein
VASSHLLLPSMSSTLEASSLPTCVAPSRSHRWLPHGQDGGGAAAGGNGGSVNWRASGCGPTVEAHAGGVRSQGRRARAPSPGCESGHPPPPSRPLCGALAQRLPPLPVISAGGRAGGD